MSNSSSEGISMITLKDSAEPRRGVAVYELIDDKYAGFIDAVNNSQTRLALEYAVHLIRDLNNELFYAVDRIEKLEAKQVAPRKKAASKTQTKAEKEMEEVNED